ncbi:unnamed protein product [Orchesella dallaii]|uniref:Uncharacterized protein n=1 Tax=Orchesella dallaii TaxID=48710 RepID=A0ABP1QG75_9HEXA
MEDIQTTYETKSYEYNGKHTWPSIFDSIIKQKVVSLSDVTKHGPPSKDTVAFPNNPSVFLIDSATEGPAAELTLCETQPEQEATIEIASCGTGFGISIEGGSNSHPDSIDETCMLNFEANNDHLRPDEHLHSENNENLQSNSHSEAVATFQQTPNTVTILVNCDEVTDDGSKTNCKPNISEDEFRVGKVAENEVG